jgi:hypothetical protein
MSMNVEDRRMQEKAVMAKSYAFLQYGNRQSAHTF